MCLLFRRKALSSSYHRGSVFDNLNNPPILTCQPVYSIAYCASCFARHRRGSDGFHLNSRVCNLYETGDGSFIRG